MMLLLKVKQGEDRQCQGGASILDRVVREDNIKKLTFRSKHEGSERLSCAELWERILARENGKFKGFVRSHRKLSISRSMEKLVWLKKSDQMEVIGKSLLEKEVGSCRSWQIHRKALVLRKLEGHLKHSFKNTSLGSKNLT